MRRRLSFLVLVSVLAAVPLLHTGCEPRVSMPFTAEVEDPNYRRGKELLRMGREQEALGLFLKVIDERGGAAAESHLEAGILYQRHIKDPIAAVYHYRRYRELRPNTEQSRMVLQSIEACIREFARTLPAQPLDSQVGRTDLMDSIDRLQRENLQLKEQLVAARATVLQTTRSGGANGQGNGLSDPVMEPSQGGFALDAPGAVPEYAAPVAVTPVLPSQAPVLAAPAPRPQATAPTPMPAGYRKHIVNRGDTLMSLSLRYYGSRTRWREIYAVNRDVLPNESALKIGMELKIPQ